MKKIIKYGLFMLLVSIGYHAGGYLLALITALGFCGGHIGGKSSATPYKKTNGSR